MVAEHVPALEIAGVSHRYARESRAALDRIDLVVRAGEFVAILGPNGSGKSTLFHFIAGLLSPRAGSIAVMGERDAVAMRRRLGVVFQTPALDPHLSVAANLRDQAALYGLGGSAARARAEEALARAGLGAMRSRRVDALSGGERRRVDLCRALLHGPELLLLDEPTVGLDPGARERFLDDLENRRASGGLTILMSTHLVDEADRASRVVLVHEGRIVADGAPAVLRAQLGAQQVTVQRESWTPPADTAGEWTLRRGGWTSALEGDELARLAASLVRAEVPFSIAPPTLADLFESLTGSALDAQEPSP